MKTLVHWGGAAWVLMALMAAPLQAAEPKQPDPPAGVANNTELAGRYHLDGIMETGSELLLGKDGRFQWYFTYGALDLDAEGRWQRDGDSVVLVPDIFHFPPQYPETEFKRMQLRIDGSDLIPAWPWDDGNERGRYTRD